MVDWVPLVERMTASVCVTAFEKEVSVTTIASIAKDLLVVVIQLKVVKTVSG